jgi:cysteinyl-tRNA synthetase
MSLICNDRGVFASAAKQEVSFMKKKMLPYTALIMTLIVVILVAGVIPGCSGGPSAARTPKPPESGNKAAAMPNDSDYKQKMIVLVEQISRYAKARNPSFQVMGNNGLALFQPEEVSGEYLQKMLGSVDGIIMEGFQYGWEMKDDARTPATVRAQLARDLAAPVARALPVLNIDYCYSRLRVDKSYQLNDQNGFIGFAADRRQLDTIPAYPGKIHRENDNHIDKLQQVNNFIVLFDPQKFPDKKTYLESLQNTNYDLLIIDMYFDGEPLSSNDVAALKVKKNGASRLVFSYMSIGEAEDYRPYWKTAWSKHPPKWLAENNPDWPGNYKVEYWTPEWKQILFGSPESYLDRILATGFDGVFMDIMDAFEYFEERQ